MKKKIFSIFIAAITMIACSENQAITDEEQELVESQLSSEKNQFEVVYTQKGVNANTVAIFGMTTTSDGLIDSSILDAADSKDLGNPTYINMHERDDGIYTYKSKDKVGEVLIILNVYVLDDATSDLEVNIKVYRDDVEVYNQDEIIKVGVLGFSRNFTIK